VIPPPFNTKNRQVGDRGGVILADEPGCAPNVGPNGSKNNRRRFMDSTAVEIHSEIAGKGAFERFFKLHWSRVLAVVIRVTHDRGRAEELVQDTMLRLYRRWALVRNPEAWVYRVGLRMALNSVRSEIRRTNIERKAEVNAAATGPDPESTLQAGEEAILVRRALAGMRERRAQLLILRYSGLSFADVARLLGLSPGSIGTLLDRAEKDFQKRYLALSKRDLRSTPGGGVCI